MVNGKKSGSKGKVINQPKAKPKGSPSVKAEAAPIARSAKSRSSEPVVKGGYRSTRIKHRELLGSVAGATSFTVQSSYVLNPGMAATFPWLSTQATGWEQYRFHSLCFCYIPRCATTKVGSVILAPDYDSLDAAPSSELIATSYRDASEGASWQDLKCQLAPAALHPIGPRKYIREGSIAFGDYKTYDGGRLHVCSTEQDDTANVGKLWVDYDVEFFVPQAEDASAPSSRYVGLLTTGSNQGFTTGAGAILQFSTEVANPLGLSNSSGTITLPKGCYLVRYHFNAGDSSAEAFTVTAILRKNAVSAGGQCIVGPASVAAGGDWHAAGEYIIASDGDDTVDLFVTLTGAAGTLTVTSGAQVCFMLI